MALFLHISIAMLSLLASAITYLSPAKIKFQASYVLVALTIISGTYLVVSTHANMVSACITGLVYLAVVFGALVLARNKLSKKQAQSNFTDS